MQNVGYFLPSIISHNVFYTSQTKSKEISRLSSDSISLRCVATWEWAMAGELATKGIPTLPLTIML